MGGPIAFMDLLPAMFKPELNLLGRDSVELSLELDESVCRRISINGERGVQNVKLFWGSPCTIILSFKLTETGKSLATMLEPFRNLSWCDTQSCGKLGFLLERRVRIFIKSSLKGIFLSRCNAPL